MNNCIELIYDRFNLEFYPEDGIQFNSTLTDHSKIITTDQCVIFDTKKYLSVGNHPQHTTTTIKSNDTPDDVTTSVTEEYNNEQYVVNIHFEFKKPTSTAVSLVEAFDFQPFHVVLKHQALDGKSSLIRVIQNGLGQFRSTITENQGVINVNMTIVNTNGIQLIVE